MKFNELLEEVKYGSEDYRKLKYLEKIEESSSEDYKVSFLLENSLKNLNEEKEIMNLLNQAYSQIKNYERKKVLVSELKEGFVRMKFDSLKNIYSDLVEKINSSKLDNEKLLCNSVALVKYMFDELNERVDMKINFPELNISEEVNKELSFIKKNL